MKITINARITKRTRNADGFWLIIGPNRWKFDTKAQASGALLETVSKMTVRIEPVSKARTQAEGSGWLK